MIMKMDTRRIVLLNHKHRFFSGKSRVPFCNDEQS